MPSEMRVKLECEEIYYFPLLICAFAFNKSLEELVSSIVRMTVKFYPLLCEKPEWMKRVCVPMRIGILETSLIKERDTNHTKTIEFDLDADELLDHQQSDYVLNDELNRLLNIFLGYWKSMIEEESDVTTLDDFQQRLIDINQELEEFDWTFF